jgi:hypothetical protein
MSVDLSAPVVKNMGEHDPLEGLICILTAMETESGKTSGLKSLLRDMKDLYGRRRWATPDPLGAGRSLLNTARSAELAVFGLKMPDAAAPGRLFPESMESLQEYEGDP